MTPVTDVDYQKKIGEAEDFVLAFTASYCQPCKELKPRLEALNQDTLPVFSAALEEAPMLANRYGVRSVPTLILFKCGQVVATQRSPLLEGALRRWVSQS